MLLTWEDLDLFKEAVRKYPAAGNIVDLRFTDGRTTEVLTKDQVLLIIEGVARGHRPPQS